MLEEYYKDKDITIYNCDCIEGMKQLPEGLYGPIVTSPPYNIGKSYEPDTDFGSYLKLLSDFYVQALRIAGRGNYAIVIFADYYIWGGSNTIIQPMTYLHHLIGERAGWAHQCIRIWQKDFATLVDPYSISGTLPKQEHEYIATFRKPGGGREKVREHQFHPHSIWSTSGKKQKVATLKLHTAAYPEYLVKMILDVYSDEGDTVIDPFGGSGTTCAVAKKMGRKSIMFDTNMAFCEVAKQRLSQQVFEFAEPVLPERTMPGDF